MPPIGDTMQFNIVFPSDADTLTSTAAFEAASFALVGKANTLATRARAARGEYRAVLEEKIRGLLYDAAASYPPGTYRGGCAPYITKGGAPWRKPWAI
jgi:hypothetical protein